MIKVTFDYLILTINYLLNILPVNDERRIMKKIVMTLLLIVSTAASAIAIQKDEGCTPANTAHTGEECSKCHNLGVDEAGKLLADVGKVISVRHSAVRGLYEVSLESQGKTGFAYIDFSRKHLIAGNIFSVETKKPVTGTPDIELQKKPSKVDINALPVKNSIILGNPEGKKKLFVFTDPDCPYCSKMHMELIKLTYMEPDLAIYVKLFPLKMHPGAYDKSRVILGGDSVYLLNRAFAGEPLPAVTEKDSKEPVDQTIRFGESLGITGTPTVIFPNGTIMPGYKEAGELKKLIEGK